MFNTMSSSYVYVMIIIKFLEKEGVMDTDDLITQLRILAYSISDVCIILRQCCPRVRSRITCTSADAYKTPPNDIFLRLSTALYKHRDSNRGVDNTHQVASFSNPDSVDRLCRLRSGYVALLSIQHSLNSSLFHHILARLQTNTAWKSCRNYRKRQTKRKYDKRRKLLTGRRTTHYCLSFLRSP